MPPDAGRRPPPTLLMDRRMSDVEALMWAAERDPVLRSSFLTVTVCDRPLDAERFRRRMGLAVAGIPRLRQRVADPPTPLSVPTWVDDASFDLDAHVRTATLPPPGTRRQLLDLAADLAARPHVPGRPLWEMVVVDGLEDGGGALLAKLHHAITDGVGGVRLSGSFIDLAPDQDDPTLPPPPVEEGAGGGGLVGGVADVVRRQVDAARSTMQVVLATATDPSRAVGSVRQLLETDPARSTLWSGRRGTGRRIEAASFDLATAKAAAGRLGGTVNDLFVTAVCEAAAAAHADAGVEVGDLRTTMPISTREGRTAGGNAFFPARVLVPCGPMAPHERFALVHERLAAAREGPSLGVVHAMAGVLTSVPAQLVSRLARMQTDTVDFATSNVRGAPFDLWIAGAKILGNHPVGPTGGTAFNATVLSTSGSLDLGLVVDTAAVGDAARLLAHLRQGFAALV